MKKRKFLGIDYGEKRVGIAVSDDSGKLAFPKAVFSNDRLLISNILAFCKDEGVNVVVIGASHMLSGKDNTIMKAIRDFKKILEEKFGGKVFFESELFTTAAAKRIVGETNYTDASAAAIILQTFLDTRR